MLLAPSFDLAHTYVQKKPRVAAGLLGNEV